MTAPSQQKIGLATATIVGMNAMIGAGIFTVPAALASNVGPAGILTYAFVIIAVWCMALSIARLAQHYPEEGSFYTYARQWGGHMVGMIATGAYMIGLLIAMGLLAQRAGTYLYDAVPFTSAYNLGLITLWGLTALNMIGIPLSEFGQKVLIACTVFPLLSTVAICFSHAHFEYLTPFAPYGFTNVLAATRAVIFGFFGFECAASLFRIVKEPQKNVPRALTYGVVLVGLIYLLFVASLIIAVPLDYFIDPCVPLTDVLRLVFPGKQWIITIIHVSILSAIIGTLHSMLWSASTLLISYVKKCRTPMLNQLVNNGWLNQRSAVFAIGFSIFLSYITLKNQDLFFSLTAIFIIVAFVLSMITLLIKEQWQSRQGLITVIGMLTAFVIFYFACQGVIGAIL